MQKIRSLEVTYGAIRRARGDGNCFFRSFIFALFEHILQHRDYDERYRCARGAHRMSDMLRHSRQGTAQLSIRASRCRSAPTCDRLPTHVAIPPLVAVRRMSSLVRVPRFSRALIA